MKGKMLLNRFVSIFLCAILAVSIGVGCKKPVTPQTPQDDEEEELVELMEDIVINDKVRIQLLSDTLVRIEERGIKGFENRASFYVSNRDWARVKYTKAEANGKIIITSSKYIITVPSDATNSNDVLITDKGGSELWASSSKTTGNVYLPSPSDELKSWYFTDSPRIIPSEYGYSAVADSAPLQGWDFNNNALDYFVFLPGGDYRQFCLDYTSLTGKSEMVSLQMLGFWDSRWYEYSADTALQQIADYREKGFPIDILVIDTDWRASSESGIGYDINETLFPNMTEFLAQCEALGVNIMFNDHPEPVAGVNNSLDKAEVAYRNEKLTLLLSMGLDYWWYDRNWHTALKPISSEVSVFAFGMYAFQWITNEYFKSTADLEEYAKRALIMGNVDGCMHGKFTYASDISAHRNSIQWTGDIASNNIALQQEIETAILGGAELGLPYISSDIGGHTAPVTDDMYARWIQYGALSSILRVHCTHSKYIEQTGRMPWMFGDEAEAISMEYIEMRYRLLPLYYNLARENYDTGLPIMRRLDIDYPQYAEASRNDQYLLGDSILVAPISDASTKVVPSSWLTHNDNGTTKPGLVGEYFNTNNFTGASKKRVDSEINFDWGTGGPSLTGSDNFSIIWRGNITIGSAPATLSFFADDGIEVYIDGTRVIDGMAVYDKMLTTAQTYAANSTHTIEVKYNEIGGGAHVYMYYDDGAEVSNSRSVFIPDGTWMDVWSGESFVGPATINVAHSLKTSPIFIKQGSVVALAENMESTNEKDWSNMALDIYPSTTSAGKTTIYEDDTKTQGYKDNQFRTTLIESGAVSVNSQTIKIGAAKGSFGGDKAFTERTYTVRIHAYLGAVSKITVNGKSTAFTYYQKSSSASPFAFSGSALDSDIYEFTLETEVSSEYEIKVTYASVSAAALTAPEYDNASLDFDVSIGAADNSMLISDKGEYDWAVFGAGNYEVTARKSEDGLIGTPKTYGNKGLYPNSALSIDYTGGTEGSGYNVLAGIKTEKDITLTLKSAGNKEYFVVYLAGTRCTAKLTVRDRAGNVKTIFVGNINGDFIKRVVIKANAAVESELYLTYALHTCVVNGYDSSSVLGIIAAYVTATLTEPEIISDDDLTGTLVSTLEGVDYVELATGHAITNSTNLDWRHFGYFENETITEVKKVGGSSILSVVFTEGRAFWDYQTLISFTGGDVYSNPAGTRHGTCTPGSILLAIDVPAGTNFIQLYTGAWRSKNTTTIKGISGKVLATAPVFIAGDSSVCKVITFKTQSDKKTRVFVEILSTEAGIGGNVSLAAVSVFNQNA